MMAAGRLHPPGRAGGVCGTFLRVTVREGGRRRPALGTEGLPGRLGGVLGREERVRPRQCRGGRWAWGAGEGGAEAGGPSPAGSRAALEAPAASSGAGAAGRPAGSPRDRAVNLHRFGWKGEGNALWQLTWRP